MIFSYDRWGFVIYESINRIENYYVKWNKLGVEK